MSEAPLRPQLHIVLDGLVIQWQSFNIVDNISVLVTAGEGVLSPAHRALAEVEFVWDIYNCTPEEIILIRVLRSPLVKHIVKVIKCLNMFHRIR